MNVSCNFVNNGKIELQALIKYFNLKGLTPTEIKAELDLTLFESASSFLMVKNWVAEFKRDRTSTNDEPRSGRPKTATLPDIIEKVHHIVLNDRRVKVRKIADIMGISNDSVHRILTEELEMKKYLARWVPRLLAPRCTGAKTESFECVSRPFETFSPRSKGVFASFHNRR